ncbi:MAG: radical SAM protein [Candidatus Omnitrophica bacterium]|jgi:radical SAM superfamily enzyme YgiQ (UPF0313 family)|nr:radical SAM protein [Candidatus Omnitrophota bacterium]
MYKKVYLVSPSLSPFSEKLKAQTPPVGLGYIASMLDTNNIEYQVCDMNLGYPLPWLIKQINYFKPDLVAFTTHSLLQHKVIYSLINKISGCGFDTVIGGPLVSSLGTNVLKESNVTYAIKYEGEYAILELCKGNQPKDIKNLIYRENGNIIENEDRPRIKSLDEIPFPRYKKFELEKYLDKRIHILSSRGCPNNCSFCQFKVLSGNEFRPRGLENVLEEIKYWYAKGYREIEFCDDNLNIDKNRIYKLCELIKKNNLKNLELIAGYVSVNNLDKDLLALMKSSGFKKLSLGVESGSDKVLKTIGKPQTVLQIKKAIKESCKIGLAVNLDMTIGHPKEKVTDVFKSILLSLTYPIANAYFWNLIPLPNTKLYNWVKRNNYFVIPIEKYANFDIKKINETPVFETSEFKAGQRKIMLLLSHKVTGYIKIKNKCRLFLRKLFLDMRICLLPRYKLNIFLS